MIIENTPHLVEKRRNDFLVYDASRPVRMVTGHKIFLQPGCKTSETYYVFRRQHIKELIALARIDFQSHPQGGEVAIDVGANVGYISSWLATRPDIRLVRAIEPNSDARQILELNAKRYEKIIVTELLIGDFCGRKELNIYESSGWASVMKPESTLPLKSVSCKQTTLDELISHEKIAFIKIDVQGAEAAVLRGAQKIITDSRPVLWLEFTPEDVGSDREELIKEVTSVLKKANLYCFSVREDGSFLRISLDSLESFSGDLFLMPDEMLVRMDYAM